MSQKTCQIQEISDSLKKYGVSMINDIREAGKGPAISNTYFLQADDGDYLIDPGAGKGGGKTRLYALAT